MKSKILLSIFVLFSVFAFAKHIPVEFAKKIAKNFYYERVNQVKSMKYEEVSLSFYRDYSSQKSFEPAFYIFNVGENNGYVIVSADDALPPVLGYSFKKSFHFEKISPTLLLFLNDYATALDEIRMNRAIPKTYTKNQWDELNYDFPAKSVKNIMTVQPLLLTEWNQDFPFNALCPTLASHNPPQTTGGSSGRAYVGCVAVAMGQVMKFYNYPSSGLGSYSNPSYANGGYPTQSVNFANQTYNWSEMQYSLAPSSANYDEVAKILYHLGVALHMNWGPDGSGTQTSLIVTALENYFKYSSTCSLISKSNYNDSGWKTAIKQQLDQNRPIVYSGLPATGAGHAWNCDGYQGNTGNEYFHQNWGWGGYNDGFYRLDSLWAPASPGQPSEQFINQIQAVINIYPNTGYPEYCTSSKTYSSYYANFDDGSGNQNYQNNNNCQYLIQPACGKYITLQFDKFDVSPGDVVNIYDGSNSSATLLGTINGGETPGVYVSTGNALFINFITNGSTNSSGWSANYSVVNCKYGITVTQTSGTIDDGSSSCDYEKSSNCSWNIDIPNASTINVNFTSFNLAADADFVSVYKTDLSVANLIGKYQSTNVPSGTIAVPSNKAIIRFFSNSTLNAQGWSLNYSSILTDIKQPENNITDLHISPNPFADDATININLQDNGNMTVSVTNMIGQELYSAGKYTVAGNYSYSLKSLVPKISDGIYFVTLKTDKNKIVKKVICSK